MSTAPSRGALFGYGALAVPLAFAGLPVYLHAPDLYATHYGVSLATIGMVLLAVRVFDAVQDPILGLLGDRFDHRPGWPLGWMIALALGVLMLFHPPERLTALWLALSLLIATTAYSALTIHLATLGGLWGKDPTERARIAGVRESLGLVGLLLAAVLPTVLMHGGSSVVQAFHAFSLWFLMVLIVGGVCFLDWLRRQTHRRIDGEHPAGWALARIARGHGRFFAVYFLSALAAAMPAVLVIPFVRDRLEAESFTGLFLALYFLSGAMGMKLWVLASDVLGPWQAWLLSMILAIVGFIWAFALGSGDVVAFSIICVVTGLAFGADLSLPHAIAAGLVEQDDASHEASQYFAALTFLGKLALAVAGGLTLPLLDAAGFVPGGSNDARALLALSVAYALAPCAIKLASAGLAWHWRLARLARFHA